MIEIEIQEIEEAIQKKLPLSYRSILLNYPVELTQLGNLQEPISLLVLPDIKEKIFGLNKFVGKWLLKSNKVVIGEDGCGGYFFMDLTDEKVYELDHENPKYHDEAQKLLDFEGSMKVIHNNINDYIRYHLSGY